MKVKLIFDINKEEEMLKLKQCMVSGDLVFIISQLFRRRERLEQELDRSTLAQDWSGGVDLIYSELSSMLDEYNINIDNLQI